MTDFAYITRQPVLEVTRVCGTVKPPRFSYSVTVNIHDVTPGEDLLLATGTSGATGKFASP